MYCESEPREGGEAETAKIRVEITQRKAREFWKSPSENGAGEFHVLACDVEIVRDFEGL